MRTTAAFTISKNHKFNEMEVSPLIVGKEAVEKFYKDYSSLPESERGFNVLDIFMYDDLDKANEDYEYALYREGCSKVPTNDEEYDEVPEEAWEDLKKMNSPNGWYTDNNGNVYQDYEQSIGE